MRRAAAHAVASEPAELLAGKRVVERGARLPAALEGAGVLGRREHGEQGEQHKAGRPHLVVVGTCQRGDHDLAMELGASWGRGGGDPHALRRRRSPRPRVCVIAGLSPVAASGAPRCWLVLSERGATRRTSEPTNRFSGVAFFVWPPLFRPPWVGMETPVSAPRSGAARQNFACAAGREMGPFSSSLNSVSGRLCETYLFTPLALLLNA